MKKKLTALIASVLAAATLTGCLSSTTPKADDKSGSASTSTSTAATKTDARVFRIGAVSNPTDIMAEAGQMFCDLATERLGGEIVFEYHPGEQLGNSSAMLLSLIHI